MGTSISGTMLGMVADPAGDLAVGAVVSLAVILLLALCELANATGGRRRALARHALVPLIPLLVVFGTLAAQRILAML